MRQILANEIALRALELLHRNIEDPLTINEIAREVKTNSTTLKQVFKIYYGTSISSFGRKLRLSKAMTLLVSTDWDVNRIAVGTGFCDGPSFSVAFKKLTGESPGRWRANNLNAIS